MVVSGYPHAVKVLGFIILVGIFFLPNFHGIAEGKEVWVLLNSLLLPRFSPLSPRYSKSEMTTPLASRWTDRLSKITVLVQLCTSD